MARRKIKTIGDRVKMARKEAGLSQKELGDKLQLSDKTISAYEVDRAVPSLGVLKKMGVVVNRPVAYFLDDNRTEAIELQIKLDTIERELAAIRKYLADKAKKE